MGAVSQPARWNPERLSDVLFGGWLRAGLTYRLWFNSHSPAIKKQNFPLDFHQTFFRRAKNSRQDAPEALIRITKWKGGEKSRKGRGLVKSFIPSPPPSPTAQTPVT